MSNISKTNLNEYPQINFFILVLFVFTQNSISITTEKIWDRHLYCYTYTVAMWWEVWIMIILGKRDFSSVGVGSVLFWRERWRGWRCEKWMRVRLRQDRAIARRLKKAQSASSVLCLRLTAWVCVCDEIVLESALFNAIIKSIYALISALKSILLLLLFAFIAVLPALG